MPRYSHELLALCVHALHPTWGGVWQHLAPDSGADIDDVGERRDGGGGGGGGGKKILYYIHNIYMYIYYAHNMYYIHNLYVCRYNEC